MPPINRRKFIKSIKQGTEQPYSDIQGNKYKPVEDPNGNYSRLFGKKYRMEKLPK